MTHIVVHFGASDYSDYTKHKDDSRKDAYIQRHKKNENWTDFKTAGFFAKHILWNKPTIASSISDYRRRLNIFNKTGKFPTKIPGYKSPGKKSKYQ